MRNFTHLYKTDLPHQTISVDIYLADRANKHGICWSAIPTIVSELKRSESTARHALQDVKKAGLLQKESRYRKNGGCSSNLYRIIWNR